MHWIAPPEKDTATANLEKRLWDATDQLRANSGLKAQARFEYLLTSPEAADVGAKVNAALDAELAALLTEFKQRVAALDRPEDMWPLAAWLREKQRAVDDKYDYRYSQLPRVFGRLVREGRVAEDELSGLAADKLSIIRRIVSL